MSDKNVNPDVLRLKDILQAITDIEAIDLKADAPRKDLLATAYSIAVIGEASSRLSERLRQANPHIPWRAMTGMRHKIVHEYSKLDITLVLAVIKEDIPLLKRQVSDVLSSLQVQP